MNLRRWELRYFALGFVFFCSVSDVYAFGMNRKRIHPLTHGPSEVGAGVSPSPVPSALPLSRQSESVESPEPPEPVEDRVACHALNEAGAHWVGVIAKVFENDVVEVEWQLENGYVIQPLSTYSDLSKCAVELAGMLPFEPGQIVLSLGTDPVTLNSNGKFLIGQIQRLFSDGVAELQLMRMGPKKGSDHSTQAHEGLQRFNTEKSIVIHSAQALEGSAVLYYVPVANLARQVPRLDRFHVGQTVMSKSKQQEVLVGIVEALFDGGLKGGTAEVHWLSADGKPKVRHPRFWPVASLSPEVRVAVPPSVGIYPAAPAFVVPSAPVGPATHWVAAPSPAIPSGWTAAPGWPSAPPAVADGGWAAVPSAPEFSPEVPRYPPMSQYPPVAPYGSEYQKISEVSQPGEVSAPSQGIEDNGRPKHRSHRSKRKPLSGTAQDPT